MARLIDADALIKEYPQASGLKLVIENAPTAYDVDNVVEELERWSAEAEIILPISKETVETKVIASGNAIDIVRKGGV